MIIPKQKLYLETSIWNFLFADDSPEKKKITERLFDRISCERYELYISRVVIAEIEKASLEKQNQFFSAIEKYAPVRLETDEMTADLAYAYIEAGILSQAHLNDLLHAAFVTTHNLHLLLSWNLKHLVKHKTRLLVNAVNKRLNYREIDICRPEEVLDIGDE